MIIVGNGKLEDEISFDLDFLLIKWKSRKSKVELLMKVIERQWP